MTQLSVDLPGLRASDNPVSTIPESTLVTSARPDMVLVRADEITLIELTVPHNSLESLSRARKRKSGREVYLQALGDLEAKGLISHLHTIEIGSLGHWLPTSQRTLLEAVQSLTKKWQGRLWTRQLVKLLEPPKSSLRHGQKKCGSHHVHYYELP